MQHRTRLGALAAALLAVTAGVTIAQPGGVKISGSAALKARTKLSGDSAVKVARATVPNGKIQSGELEDEKGKLIYSFDIKVPGKSGIEEVNVDAMTGAVVAHEHESPSAEQKEKAQEARAKAAKRPVKKP